MGKYANRKVKIDGIEFRLLPMKFAGHVVGYILRPEDEDPLKEALDEANINALPDKEQWIARRLKHYEQYWNDKRGRYVVDKDWSPTREELLEDLNKSWEFEHGEE